jgi:triacylglycerol lipase
MTMTTWRLALALGISALLLGCGDDNGDGHRAAATPTPVEGEEAAPFDRALALELGRLCIQSYQMLIDFENGQTFTLPAPYTLQRQFLTPEHYAGESITEEVPIAYVATSGDAIYVVFRGTVTISEWISDATLSQVPYAFVADGGKSETGFTAIYASIDTAITDEVNALAQNPAYRTLYVTGHSLGAALATVAAPVLARATRLDAPILYNFASPRVGDPVFAALVDELPTSWRVVNTNDEVPMLPHVITVVFHGSQPEFFFYEHIDSEYDLTFGEPIRNLTDLEEDHAMCNYYAALCDETSDPTSCKQMIAGIGGCQ